MASNQQRTLQVGAFVGQVFDVSADSVKIALGDQASTNSQIEIAGHVGDYLVIDGQELILIGQMSSATSADPLFSASASVTLLASLELDTMALTPGILRSPTLGSKAYLAPDSLVARLIEGRFSGDKQQSKVTIDLAKLSKGSGVPLKLEPEKLFGRHCAVVGTSGGGKSWTVARLVCECAKKKSKVILLDAVGEYHSLDGPVVHVHIGDDPEPREGSLEVAVPYYHLTEGDLFAIFKPAGQSQAPKLRAAMKSLKLARFSPLLSIQGLIIKADKSKLEFEKEYTKFYDEIEKPYADFNITKLSRQIENECVNFQRSAVESGIWGGVNGSDLSMCVPLINRIQDIITSKNLAAVFTPEDRPSLFSIIKAFLKDEESSVLRVSLKYLSFEHNTREIVANAIGRFLLDQARRLEFRDRPVVVFVDEAHQFLDASISDGDVRYKLDEFSLIAKEGRKYALTICIATQRPRDIPEGVLSQMGTMIVHRLINQHDRNVVEKASAGFDEYSAAAIPTLASGEAVIIGVDFPLPLFVRVHPPEYRPDSKGANYQQCWLKE